MKRIFAAAAILLIAASTAPAEASAAPAPAHHAQSVTKHHTPRTPHGRRPSNNEVTYDRDSKDPNVGWHTEGGMRVCTQDCDNPEVPGSGYTCRDISFFGIPSRECDSAGW